MKGLNKFSDQYFDKYRTTPVKLRPYSSKQKDVAEIYLNEISAILNNFNIKPTVRGSTLFEIYGKGEVEIGLYPKESDWNDVLMKLSFRFGKPEVVEKNYARFNDIYDKNEEEVEIILLKGYEAELDIRLHEFLVSRPDLLEQYVSIKKKYCYSKKEYQIQKNNFLNNVISMI